MRIIYRLFGVFVGSVVLLALMPPLIDGLNAIHNPVNKLLVLGVLAVVGVIGSLLCIDYVFRIKTTEKVVTSLIASMVLETIKFIGRTICRGSTLTVSGLSWALQRIVK